MSLYACCKVFKQPIGNESLLMHCVGANSKVDKYELNSNTLITDFQTIGLKRRLIVNNRNI